MRRLLRGLAAGVAVPVMLLAAATPAAAHSDLEEASPGPGDDVAAGAAGVHLEFGEGVATDDRNQVRLETADGAAVAVGAPSVVDDGFGVCAATADLDPGEYVLDWRVLSVDEHLVQSRYSFEVTDAGEPADLAACDGVDLASPEEPAGGGLAVGTTAIVAVGAVALLLVVLLLVRRVRADRRAEDGRA